jgi:hypothetical protein
MSSLEEEMRAKVHTILDKDLGACETTMDGSHVQRAFSFFALWRHCRVYLVQSTENALFPFPKDTSLRMEGHMGIISVHILLSPWQDVIMPGGKWTTFQNSYLDMVRNPRARLFSPPVYVSSLQAPGS